MTAYYNENDPKAAAWLRELIKGGFIAHGEVDERSIEDVKPSELVGYTQCHFFAGIGGWSLALRLAGVPDETPVWTGSCPCQPFSAAGKGKGFADERHLWPAWFHLIESNKPKFVFGEQVARSLPWVDLVQADMEAKSYTFGYVVLGAHSVGAPHVRQRLYWTAKMANSHSPRLEGIYESSGRVYLQSATRDVRAHWITEPQVDRVAYGIPGRVGLLRGYGNAIVPQAAAAFIEASGLNETQQTA